MNPAQSISSVFRQYFGFQGRACRSEYWWFSLFHFIVLIVLSIANPVLFAIYVFGTILPSLTVQVRRLHDTGRSGWWVLINPIPFICPIILLVFCVSKGEGGNNRYGPDPRLSLAEPGYERRDGSRLCTTCGSELYQGANFCRNCGAAV